MIRLPQHGSDVLITLNSPIYISEHSAAAEHAGGRHRRNVTCFAICIQGPPGIESSIGFQVVRRNLVPYFTNAALCPRYPPLQLQGRASRGRTSQPRPSSAPSSLPLQSTTGHCSAAAAAAGRHRSCSSWAATATGRSHGALGYVCAYMHACKQRCCKRWLRHGQAGLVSMLVASMGGLKCRSLRSMHIRAAQRVPEMQRAQQREAQ